MFFFKDALHTDIFKFSANGFMEITFFVQKYNFMSVKMCYLLHFSWMQLKKSNKLCLCDRLQLIKCLRIQIWLIAKLSVMCRCNTFISWIRCLFYARMSHRSALSSLTSNKKTKKSYYSDSDWVQGLKSLPNYCSRPLLKLIRTSGCSEAEYEGVRGGSRLLHRPVHEIKNAWGHFKKTPFL